MAVPIAGGAVRLLADPPTASAGWGEGYGIAVDATNAYWMNYYLTMPPVLIAPKTGPTTSSPTSAPSGWINAGAAIAVDASSIYFALIGATNGAIWKLPIAGGAPTMLAGNLQDPEAIALDSSFVYWAARGDGTIGRVPIGGGAPTVLASGRGDPRGIAVDANAVYWTEYRDGYVMKQPLAGGSPTALASGQLFPLGIAIDATNVYWTNFGGGTVERVAK